MILQHWETKMAKILKKHIINTIKSSYYKYRLLLVLLFVLIGVCAVLAFFTYGISLIFIVPILFLIQKTKKQISILRSGAEGEKNTLQILSSLPKGYYVVADVALCVKHKTAQLDYIVIGPSGIFVIEAKNHSGTISGSASSTYLNKNKHGEESEFYNPAFQVATHTRLVDELLRDNGFKNIDIKGAVFFANPNTSVKVANTASTIPLFSLKQNGAKMLLNFIKNNNTSLSKIKIKKLKKILFKNCK